MGYNKSKGLVSIVLPLYRVYRYVGEAVASLKAQTYSHFECLCLDDGSGNEMPEVVRGLVGNDPRFRVLEFENAGMAEGRNRGLNLAKGEYITFLDQDDGFHPRFLEEMVGALESYDADCAVCMFKKIGPDETVADCSVSHRPEVIWKPIESPAAFFMTTLDRNISNVWQKVFRRSSLGNLHFRKELFGADDTVFTLEAFLNFRRIVYTEAELHFYRQHEGSVTSQRTTRYTFSKFAMAPVLAPLIPETEQRHFRTFALCQINRAVKDALRYPCTKAERRALAEAARTSLRDSGMCVRWWTIGARWRYFKLWLKSL